MLLGFLIGLGLWGVGHRRNPRLLSLTIVLGLGCLVSAGKLGSDLNYFLPWRAVTSLALAEFGVVLLGATGWRLWTGLALWLACGHALTISMVHTGVQMSVAEEARQRRISSQGLTHLQQRGALKAMARDPSVHMLTDRGLLDIQQGERALFADPWLFRVMAEGGRLDLESTIEAIREKRYDVIVTTYPLNDPRYINYDFRLPLPLIEAARHSYTPQEVAGGLVIYRPNRLAGGTPP
jgi:hypothetical protein